MTKDRALEVLSVYASVNGSGRCTQDEFEEAKKMAIEALSNSEIPNNSDCISRQAAVEALWKALYEYEDRTERKFIESEDLDIADWVQHRIFVQNMSDIDRQTILAMPSAQPQWIPCSERQPEDNGYYLITGYNGLVATAFWESQPPTPMWRTKYWPLDVIAWMPLPEPYKGE